jgi:hypothetical protein
MAYDGALALKNQLISLNPSNNIYNLWWAAAGPEITSKNWE